MARFLHIGFNWRSRKPDPSELMPIFDRAMDWARYAPDSWIVYTTLSPADWYEYLAPQITETDHVFIVEIDIAQRSGYLPRDIWEWMGKPRGHVHLDEKQSSANGLLARLAQAKQNVLPGLERTENIKPRGLTPLSNLGLRDAQPRNRLLDAISPGLKDVDKSAPKK